MAFSTAAISVFSTTMVVPSPRFKEDKNHPVFHSDGLEQNSSISTANALELLQYCLTHWGRVTHICVSKLIIIGSDNGLSPGRRQAIIWTNNGILLIGPLGTNFSEILFGIQTFSFKKMHLNVSSAKWRPLCLGLNELSHWHILHADGCRYNVKYNTISNTTKQWQTTLSYASMG